MLGHPGQLMCVCENENENRLCGKCGCMPVCVCACVVFASLSVFILTKEKLARLVQSPQPGGSLDLS